MVTNCSGCGKENPRNTTRIDDGKLSGRAADTEAENEHGQKNKTFCL